MLFILFTSVCFLNECKWSVVIFKIKIFFYDFSLYVTVSIVVNSYFIFSPLMSTDLLKQGHSKLL